MMSIIQTAETSVKPHLDKLQQEEEEVAKYAGFVEAECRL